MTIARIGIRQGSTGRRTGKKAPAQRRKKPPASKRRPVHTPPPKKHPPAKKPPTTYGKPLKPLGKMALWPVGAKNNLVIPYAPREVTYTLGGRQWTEVARDGGRTPLLVNSGTALKKISFQTFLGNEDWEEPVVDVLKALETIYMTSQPLVIQWSSFEEGHWRISSLSVTSQHRQPDSNEITRATIDIEFTRASDARKNMGPTTGGKGAGTNDSKDKDDKKRPKKYKVKKGDTLMKIAMKFYGNHKAWRKIAKANDIKRPRRKLKPGRVIKLP